jgi:hypothetical protein
MVNQVLITETKQVLSKELITSQIEEATSLLMVFYVGLSAGNRRVRAVFFTNMELTTYLTI